MACERYLDTNIVTFLIVEETNAILVLFMIPKSPKF